MQINRLRTSATFQSPHVLKKSIYEMEKVGAPREDTQRKIQLDEPFNYIY
jgi:hypothetical protein